MLAQLHLKQNSAAFSYMHGSTAMAMDALLSHLMQCVPMQCWHCIFVQHVVILQRTKMLEEMHVCLHASVPCMEDCLAHIGNKPQNKTDSQMFRNTPEGASR